MGRRFRGFIVAGGGGNNRNKSNFVRSWSGMKAAHERWKARKKSNVSNNNNNVAKEDRPMGRFIAYVADVMQDGSNDCNQNNNNVKTKRFAPLSEKSVEPLIRDQYQKGKSLETRKTKKKSNENVSVLTEIKDMSALWRDERHLQVIQAFKVLFRQCC